MELVDPQPVCLKAMEHNTHTEKEYCPKVSQVPPLPFFASQNLISLPAAEWTYARFLCHIMVCFPLSFQHILCNNFELIMM